MSDDVKQSTLDELAQTVPGYLSEAAKEAHRQSARRSRIMGDPCPKCGGAVAHHGDVEKCTRCRWRAGGS